MLRPDVHRKAERKSRESRVEDAFSPSLDWLSKCFGLIQCSRHLTATKFKVFGQHKHFKENLLTVSNIEKLYTMKL